MRYAKYIRLYADQNGESHFEDLEVELAPMDFAPPAAPLNVAQFLPTARSFGVGFPAGWHGETPHPTPRRQIFCLLAGTYEVTASDGTARRFDAGDVLLLEDTAGKGHSTRIIGNREGLAFVVALTNE